MVFKFEGVNFAFILTNEHNFQTFFTKTADLFWLQTHLGSHIFPSSASYSELYVSFLLSVYNEHQS
jgi:hypothetical protein